MYQDSAELKARIQPPLLRANEETGMRLAVTVMMLRLYIGRCFARAGRGSLSSALNWAGIVGVSAVGTYLQYRGLHMTEPHSWLEIVEWATIYAVIAWAIIFLIRLIFVAPFQTFEETENRRLELARRLDDRELRQRTLNLIWDLRERGVQIRNEFPVNFPVWHRRVNEWRLQLLDAAGVLSVNLRRHLETLNETHDFPSNIELVGGTHTEDHALDLRVISEVLRRLERYLERDL
jgi:hypothetical protein